MVGEDQGLSVEFTIGNDATGKVLVYLHKNRMITVVELAPRAYSDPATVESFLHSVEWKPPL